MKIWSALATVLSVLSLAACTHVETTPAPLVIPPIEAPPAPASSATNATESAVTPPQLRTPVAPSEQASSGLIRILGTQKLPLRGNENLIEDSLWQFVPVVKILDGKLAITAGANYQTAINNYGTYLEVSSDFRISADIEVATDNFAGVSLFGILATPGGEWWQGIKRIDYGIASQKIVVNIWVGTSVKAAVSQTFNVKTLGRRMTLDLRVTGTNLIFLVNGGEAGRIKDPGLFTDGRVYLGANVAPGNQLTIYRLTAAPEPASTVQLVSPAFSETTPAKPNSLRQLAQKHGVYIGSQAGARQLLNDSQYGYTLAQEFNIVTDNGFYFSVVHPERDRYVFAPGDTVLTFAQANNMRVRGHTLVWHNTLPTWITSGNYTREELTEILKSHITTIVGRYRGKIAEWDVVNEAVDTDGSLRDTFWKRNLGPDYIDQVFRWAHEADPTALLFYNDYGAEGLGAKSDGIYKLVKSMRERGVPIDGVGLQMHLKLDALPNTQDLAENIRRLGDLGLKVDITEMDVRIKLPVTLETFAAQARVYSDIMKASLSVPGFNAFVMWGFTDRDTWITSKFPGYGAPLLFDENYQPKPAYEALKTVLDSP